MDIKLLQKFVIKFINIKSFEKRLNVISLFCAKYELNRTFVMLEIACVERSGIRANSI